MTRHHFLPCAGLLAALSMPAIAEPTDCEAASAAALAAGQTGLSEAEALAAITPHCRDAAQDSWADGLLDYCQARAGFERALAGADELGPCQDRLFRVDFELGRQLRELRQERQMLRTSVQTQADAGTEAAALRLRVLERELSELEGLARIRGLLPADPEPN